MHSLPLMRDSLPAQSHQSGRVIYSTLFFPQLTLSFREKKGQKPSKSKTNFLGSLPSFLKKAETFKNTPFFA